MKDFVKQLRNKFSRRYRHKPPKKTYLDYTIDTNDGGEGACEEGDMGESLVFNNVHTRINNIAERSASYISLFLKLHTVSVCIYTLTA